MDRLEERNFPRIDVARGRHSQPALQRGAEIGDDIAKHVVGDDHVEHLRRADHLHRQGVDKHVEVLDAGVLLRHFFERAEPEIAPEAHHIVLVGHAD